MGYGSRTAYDVTRARERMNDAFQRSGLPKPKAAVVREPQLIHLWANQSQSYGRNPHANCFFIGPSLYSYGTHFEIARIITAPNGEKAAIFNPAEYGVTTSSQQSAARFASNHLERFTGRDLSGSKEGHESNIADYKKQAADTLAAYHKGGISAKRKGALLDSYTGIAEHAAKYQAFFFPRRTVAPIKPHGLVAEKTHFDTRAEFDVNKRELGAALRLLDKDSRASLANRASAYRKVIRRLVICRRLNVDSRPLPVINAGQYLKLWRAAKKAAKRLDTTTPRGADTNERTVFTAARNSDYGNSRFEPRLHATWSHYGCSYGFAAFDRFAKDYKTTEQRANEAAEIAERDRRWKAEYEARIAHEAKSTAEIAALWRTGGADSHKLRHTPCMLRIMPQRPTRVQTSWGAEFPADDARRVWRIVSRVYAAGVAWHANGERAPVGGFEISEIKANGQVKAGCHTIERGEIEALAHTLGVA